MRFLGFISLLFLLTSCTASYHFQHEAARPEIEQNGIIRPEFQKQLYRCEVDGRFVFRKFHLSGLLYFRNLADTATRVVFQNELGITYFDFGWDRKDNFQVYHIMEQMNKPALIRTLQKDFEVFLGKNIEGDAVALADKKNQFTVTKHEFYKGFVYYYWLKERPGACFQIDYGTEKKPLVRFSLSPALKRNHPLMPDSVTIRHFRAGFTIKLKKLANNE